MKIFFIRLLLFLSFAFSFNSCSTNKQIKTEKILNEKIKLDVANNDFSKSAKDAIKYLKSLIEDQEISLIDVEIYNFHGGVYEQYCRIEKNAKILNLCTTIIGMDGSKSTNNRKIKISEFVLSLNELEQNSENQIIAAGNYQKIYIKIEEKENLFLTRRAFGLMSNL